MTTGTVPDTAPVALTSDLTREYLLHHGVCPARIDDDGRLVVALTESGSREAVDEVGASFGRATTVELVEPGELDRLIARGSAGAEHALRFGASSLDTSVGDQDELSADTRALANQPPVIRYVNALIRDAVELAASDIHLEAARGGELAIRFRRDGLLSLASAPPPVLPQAVVSRVKLLAELDTAERRRPQDGRIRVRLDYRDLDLRISTVPSLHGESVVIRLLDQGGRPVDLAQLGMSSGMHDAMAELTARPSGMVLVTGPTGSGKTTTLYSALRRRRADLEKILTVEDPIEYELPGITQVPVHQRAGVSFGSILRSILRQDPDVIMVGEMRDAVTAEVAVQAAMTGHLVLSTLHTNDAIGAIPRLLDLGVPDYLVAATLEGVLAQRLVRRICEACCVTAQPPSEHRDVLAREAGYEGPTARGAGCAKCGGTGFRGRLGLFELVRVDAAIKDAIARGARRAELAALAAERGWTTLRADGWEKVAAGLTTVEEVLRVTVD